MQVNRLFEMVYILLDKKSVTAKELAEHFHVSQRTIYRDLDVLSLAKIPIYTEKGKGGGIRLLPEFVLNKSLLSESEQQEILSALQGLSTVRAADGNGVVKKLSSIFNKNTANWVQVDFSGWDYRDGDKFRDFKTAILKRQIAEFDYYSTYGEMTHRRIEPVQLWFKSRTWYVKGFCLTRQDMRLFKLSRVKQLLVTDQPFLPRDLLCLPKPLPSAGHQKPDITLKMKISPEMNCRILDDFHESEVTQLPDGSFFITVTWPEDDWVYGTILSYGEYAQVLEPEHIREIIKGKLEKMRGNYF